MRTLTLLLLILTIPLTAEGQRKIYNYNNLDTDQIEEIRIRNLQYHNEEAAKKESGAKRSLLKQATSINANQSEYDVNYYGIHISIAFPTETIVARIDYRITSLVPALNTVDLDLIQPLVVDSVKVNGQAAMFSHVGDILSIMLPSPIATSGAFSMNVYYHGHPYSGYGYTDGGMGFQLNNGNLVCWTATEPFGSRNWWPCKDTPEDKADSVEWWIECPSNMEAAANGVMISDIDLGNGRRIFHWKHNYPITTYLIALSVANFDIVEDQWSYGGHTMPVYSYTFPNAWNYKELFDTLTIPMLNIYSDAFGIYPFVEEKLANVNCGVYGTMEHQTCSFHDPFSFYDPEYLLIHENAHQWWGDMITCKTFHHIWLNEGFGTYSEAIFYEGAYGTSQAYFNHMQVLKYMGGGTIYVEDPLNEVIFDGGLSYNKGAWVVHMLRGVLGDSTFFSAIHDWTVSSFRYGSATTEDLAASISSSIGSDMGWFFDQWIYGEGHPAYNYSWQCKRDDILGGYRVDLAIDQIQASAVFFKMPVRISLVTSGPDKDTTLWNTSWSQSYVIRMADSVTSVLYDPQEWILRTASRVPFTMHIATITCADGTIDMPYYQTFEAVGGVEPYNWSYIGGDLPFGTTFTGGETGVIEGTPNFEATYYFTLRVTDSSQPPAERMHSYSIKIKQPSELCGDADGNNIITISDAVFLINYIFAGGPTPAVGTGDPDCNGITTISDAVFLINYVFAAGPAPCSSC